MKTLKQVEQLTGIKADNLRQRIARGTLKAVKLGRDWFVEDKLTKSLSLTKESK
jgi:hypothetical protein